LGFCAACFERHRRGAHARNPFLETVLFVRDHTKTHMSVCNPAEFGALPVVDPGLVGDEPNEVVVQWHHVDLASEFGYPEAMDHVLR